MRFPPLAIVAAGTLLVPAAYALTGGKGLRPVEHLPAVAATTAAFSTFVVLMCVIAVRTCGDVVRLALIGVAAVAAAALVQPDGVEGLAAALMRVGVWSCAGAALAWVAAYSRPAWHVVRVVAALLACWILAAAVLPTSQT